MDSHKRPFKGRSLLDFPRDYVVIDIETTGLVPDFCEIIELSALRYENHELVDTFSRLVKPKGKIPPFITKFTGISNEMVEKAPPIKEVLESFLDFLIPGCIILGYNVNFDINFIYDYMLRELGRPFTNDFVDVLRIARKVERGLPNHRLQTLSEYYRIETIHHRARADCDTTYKCYLRLLEKLEG